VRIPFNQATAVGRRFINLVPELTAAILKTVEAGWDVARQREEVHPDANEVAITECLRDGMRDALREKSFPWHKKLIVAPGTESRSQPRMIRPDGRTDIPLYLVPVFEYSEEHDPHAIIECKRVAVGDAHLTREYVVEGIDRFCTGRYAGNHGDGFMAGYVLSGAPAEVVQGINHYLNGRRRAAERLARLAAYTWAWTSRHPRPRPRIPIKLHHAMLALGKTLAAPDSPSSPAPSS